MTYLITSWKPIEARLFRDAYAVFCVLFAFHSVTVLFTEQKLKNVFSTKGYF